MSDEPDNLMVVYLRRLDGTIDQVIATQRDHGRRITGLELAVANLATTEMSHYANLAVRADRSDERLDRIENRLELREG